jgi:hypothetical protein
MGSRRGPSAKDLLHIQTKREVFTQLLYSRHPEIMSFIQSKSSGQISDFFLSKYQIAIYIYSVHCLGSSMWAHFGKSA